MLRSDSIATRDIGRGGVRRRVWAPPGVAITTRAALTPDLALDLQRPGFSSDSGASPAPGHSQGRQQQPRRRQTSASGRRK